MKFDGAWWPSLIVLCVLLSGCFRNYVSAPEEWPLPPKVERPELPMDLDGDGAQDTLNQREQILVRYALELETVLNSVRAVTIEHNVKAGFMDPPEVEDAGDQPATP